MNKFRRLLATVAAVGMLLSVVPLASAGYFKDVSDDNVFSPYIAHGVGEGYFSTTNEYFYPNNNLSRAELAKIAVLGAGLEQAVNAEHDFADVPSDNAFYMFVETLLNNGMVSPNENFFPGNPVTRAEATKILVNAFGYDLDTTGGPTFNDVAADNVFYAYIETASNNGLAGGYEDGTFKPNNNITRAEAGKLLAVATGYTGEWGEAEGLALVIENDILNVGGSTSITVKVVDVDGIAVQDFDGDAAFTVSSGNISDKNVDLVNGVAKVNYSAPGYGADVDVTVSVDDFFVEGSLSVIIPEDQRMMLYSSDSIIAPTDDAVLYLTMTDEEGSPVNGLSSDLTFDVTEGDATIGNISAFPGGADGVYRAILTTNAASTGTNVISVTDNESGESTEIEVEVATPNMDIYLIDSAVSVNQTTTMLVYLTNGDGSPITGAADNVNNTGLLRASVLNSELGEITATSETEIGTGWYMYQVAASNRTADDAKIKVSYTGVTPNIHEYVSLEIAPYTVGVEVFPTDINMFTGVATVVVTLTDVNGNPIDLDANDDADLADAGDFDPTNSLDIDVITSAVWVDPTGNQNFTDGDLDVGGAADDWTYNTANAGANGNDGILVTEIRACGLNAAALDLTACTIDDNSVEIKVRSKSAVNEVVEAVATISISEPIIDEVQNFDAPAGGDLLAISVMDSEGGPIDDLASLDGTDNNDAANGSYFLLDDAGIDEIDVMHVGGGVYLLASNGDNDVDKVAVGNDDGDFQTLGAVQGQGTYVIMSDNSISEGLTGGTAGRGGVIAVNVDAGPDTSTAFGAAVTVTSDDSSIETTTLVTPANGTAVIAIDADGDGGLDADDDTETAGIVLTNQSAGANDFVATPVDEIETADLTVATGGTTLRNNTYSVHPIRVKFSAVDFNGQTTDDAYGFVKTVDHDGRLITGGAAGNITIDVDGSASAAEVTVDVFDAGMMGTVAHGPTGLYTVMYNRADNNNDSNEEATIEFQLQSDDESPNISKWKFDLVNPEYDVYVQETTTYVTPNSDSAAGAVLEAANAIFILAVSRDDEGVGADIPNATTEMTIELAQGDGDVDVDLTRTSQDTVAMAQPNDNNVARIPGVYTAFYLPGDTAREANLELYTGYDDDNDKFEFTVDVVYPTAQLVVFPPKINPDKQNNEATLLATYRDQFGNPILNLALGGNNPDASVEIEGDQRLTSSSVATVAPVDTVYYGSYTTDKTGTQAIEVKYNDDETLFASEIEVEMSY